MSIRAFLIKTQRDKMEDIESRLAVLEQAKEIKQ
jgi:hypothetical protein